MLVLKTRDPERGPWVRILPFPPDLLFNMEHKDFYIGLEFYQSGRPYRCTDVGTRTATAIYLDPELDPSWFKGPTYAVVEHVIDEDDMRACKLEGRHD